MNSDNEFPELDRNIELECKVRRSFDSSTLALLTNHLYESYKTVAESHDAELGFNNQTFGTNLYYISVHNLIKAAKEDPERIKLKSRFPVFRLEIGEYEVGAYKVGKYAADNIWTSFPGADGAAKSAELTPYFPGMERPDYLQSRHIILAHMGNPEDLLCAAYLCIPANLGPDDRISEWGFVYPIFSEMNLMIPTLEASKPPVETAREAVVKRKDRQEQVEGGNAQ